MHVSERRMEESAPAGQLPWLALGSRWQLPQRRLVERDRCEPTQCYFSFSVALTWLFPLSWQKLKLLLAYRAAKVTFVFNFGFSVYLPNSFVLNVPNVPQCTKGNRKGWTTELDSIMLIPAPGHLARHSCCVCLLITAFVVLSKREKRGEVVERMQVLISTSQGTGTHRHLRIVAILSMKKSRGWNPVFFRE